MLRHQSITHCGRYVALVTSLTTLATTVILATSTKSALPQVKCATPTFKFYPGSALAKVRYGEDNFSFDVCTDTTPASWAATASVSTNSTGKNLGITFDTATIVPVRTTTNTRVYDGTFRSTSCLPRVGFPCYGSGTWTVRFAASKVRAINPRDTVLDPSVVVLRISSPEGLRLYRTP